jgi:DtxR family Mn-dependent transcriptional regulator
MTSADRLETLSETMQMYLKTISEIESHKGAARVTDIARSLDVRNASVTSALKSLAARKLINYAPYDVITLTPLGKETTAELERRYTVLRDFFVSVLGIAADDADTEACHLEHHLSDSLRERLIGFIEYYQHCPTVKFRWEPTLGNFCVDPD